MTSQILTIDRLKLSTLFLTSMLVPADRYWEIDMCDLQLPWGSVLNLKFSMWLLTLIPLFGIGKYKKAIDLVILYPV